MICGENLKKLFWKKASGISTGEKQIKLTNHCLFIDGIEADDVDANRNYGRCIWKHITRQSVDSH